MFANLSSRIQNIVDHPHEVFPEVLIAGLVGTGVVIFIHLVFVLVGRKPSTRRRRWNLWEKLVYFGILVSVAMLGATAFYAVLRHGAMHGWWLFAHMFGAGAFTGVLPLLAITWARANRFGREPAADSTPDAETPEDAVTPAPRFFWLPKFLFWLVIVSGLVVILTMLLSMLPLFGTEGLLNLLDLHRYSGLLAVIALTLHFYCVLLQRIGLR